MNKTTQRVLHIHLGQDHGGAETFFLKLVAALARRGVVQQAIVPQGRIWISRLRASGCDVVELKPRHKLLSILDNIAIKRLALAFAPNAVMAWMSRAARRMPQGNWTTIGRLGGYYPVRFYKRCAHLVGNTPDLVKFMLAGGRKPGSVHMISNFPDMMPVPPVDRARYDTPVNTPLLIAMGRLDESKGFDVLLRALQTIDGAYLWLLGAGDERFALETLAASLGVANRVRFLGWIEYPAAYIAAADIFVLPSRHEPLGNVILEAWACNKPVVSTASEGPQWIVQDNINGLLVPVDDAAALSAAVTRVMHDADLATQLVAGGRDTLAAQFSEDAVCDAYLQLFNAAHS